MILSKYLKSDRLLGGAPRRSAFLLNGPHPTRESAEHSARRRARGGAHGLPQRRGNMPLRARKAVLKYDREEKPPDQATSPIRNPVSSNSEQACSILAWLMLSIRPRAIFCPAVRAAPETRMRCSFASALWHASSTIPCRGPGAPLPR